MALTRNPLHIGAGGELLVQYQLLKLGIDSARMTTDAGIDLVVYTPGARTATTVQVKTVDRATPAGGGNGKMAIGWYFPHETPAELLAFVLLERDLAWLFTADEARATAQQHSDKGIRRLYWYTDLSISQRDGVPLIETDLDQHLLERRAALLFPTGSAHTDVETTPASEEP
ncbi:hypothetical protein KK092_07315 [Curtobacterium flaccumfaciens pv. flaccumfaciens]|uniref:hypothetical protein n=1 Tax=Curtobacterium flaccumfaciens TaxID=2035 RepID=UPI001BDF7117|nr:hypothetical protein [Curtobacterium flaccumfaciens]MBT1669186.1 hypothetical protein [Curtobacterium flaccumfaciens pv. flaccumfaciens]